MKTATTIYLANSQVNLKELKEELKLFYNLRSKIVHGDFNELKKMLIKYSKGSDLELYLGEITGNLYSHLRTIIKIYLERPNFIDFLRAS